MRADHVQLTAAPMIVYEALAHENALRAFGDVLVVNDLSRVLLPLRGRIHHGFAGPDFLQLVGPVPGNGRLVLGLLVVGLAAHLASSSDGIPAVHWAAAV